MHVGAAARLRHWGRAAGLIDSKTFALVSTAAVVCCLGVVPLLFLIWNSFKEVGVGRVADFGTTNFTLINYLNAYGNPRVASMLANSLSFASGALLVALFFGGAMAFLVERTDTPLKGLAVALMLVPLITPSLMQGIAWTLLLHPNIGLLNGAARALGADGPLFSSATMPALWWAEGISLSPLPFLLLGATLRTMDSSLEEAAYVSGANRIHTFFRISVRLLTPAIAGVALLTFVRGIESFDVPLIMGLPAQPPIVVFSTLIWLNTEWRTRITV